MNKKTVFIIFCGLILMSLFCYKSYGQKNEEYLQKYNQYQQRFYNDFIFDSADPMMQGSSLPVELRRTRTDGKVVVYWADGVWWLGHYVAVLALEYHRLKLTSQDTIPTLNRLRVALNTYKRLDFMAESCWGDTTKQRNLNGFYLRDDISQDLKMQFKADIVSSDYIRYCGKLDSKGNAPSQDQAWASYIGLALVKKIVQIPDIQKDVKEIAYYLVKGMQNESGKKDRWEVVNPVNGDIIQKHGDIEWLRYAHAKIGTYLTGEEMTFKKSDKIFWKNMWKLLQNNFLIDKHGHFNWYGVMSLSAVLNEGGRGEENCYDWLVNRSNKIVKKRPDLEQSMMFPHLPLVNVLLHGYDGKKTIAKIEYEKYLDLAPEIGAFYYVNGDSVHRSTPPWNSLSLFCPWHNKDVGEFNMLDYMFLYNAYWIVYEANLPEYKMFFNANEETEIKKKNADEDENIEILN